ncbi:MAG: hypothetical protein JRJ02_11655 [Deltaproteobacteria bacterium]|nr:hypothetical protein [Deltaproteobacteria bacterium]
MKKLKVFLYTIIFGVVGTANATLVLDNGVILDDPLSSHWSAFLHDVGWYYI